MRDWVEPEEARQDRQPRPGALELPLPEFIEQLYVKRFGRERPEVVMSIEERVRRAGKKKAERKARRTLRAQATAEITVEYL